MAVVFPLFWESSPLVDVGYCVEAAEVVSLSVVVDAGEVVGHEADDGEVEEAGEEGAGAGGFLVGYEPGAGHGGSVFEVDLALGGSLGGPRLVEGKLFVGGVSAFKAEDGLSGFAIEAWGVRAFTDGSP